MAIGLPSVLDDSHGIFDTRVGAVTGGPEVIERAEDVGPLLEKGQAQLALVIPPDFASDLVAGRPAQVQAIVDGSDANTATIILAYTQGVVESYAARAQLAGTTPPRRAVTVASRVWYNEELVSRNMIVPGLVAVIMMIIAAMLTSLTIAREWERGTMEQLAATPVSRAEVVLGKLLPYVAIGFVDVVLTSALGVLLFDVPFRGSVFLLAVLSLLFLVGGLASAGELQIAGQPTEGGLSGVLLDACVPVITGLSQGCTPIGPVREVTDCRGPWIRTLDRRPALAVLKEDVGEVLARDLRRIEGFVQAALPLAGSDRADAKRILPV